MLTRKNSIVLVAAALILVIGFGAARQRLTPKDKVEVHFTESDLDTLESQITGLEFEDLEGLTGEGTSLVGFSSEDLDRLGAALESLEFEDLEGLTSP